MGIIFIILALINVLCVYKIVERNLLLKFNGRKDDDRYIGYISFTMGILLIVFVVAVVWILIIYYPFIFSSEDDITYYGVK